MLEYYLLSLVLEAAYDALDAGRLSREKALVVDGYPVTRAVSLDDVLSDISLTRERLWGGWEISRPNA